MPEIGTSGSMSGDGKRSAAAWPKLPRPSSTLPFLPFVTLQHHGSYRGYRRHVADGAGRPSLTQRGHKRGVVGACRNASVTPVEF